jgi:hypothetical protein
MKQFIIKLKSGNNYIASTPDEWDFSGFVRSIHATGYWMDPAIYISLAEIAFMMPLGPSPLRSESELAAMPSEGSA